MGKEAREGHDRPLPPPRRQAGVLVEVNCETDFVARNPEFHTLVRHLAEHIAAAAPSAIDKDGVPPERVERERRLFEEQVRESGKPAHLIDKIVTGKIESFYKDVALVHQRWVRDDKIGGGRSHHGVLGQGRRAHRGAPLHPVPGGRGVGPLVTDGAATDARPLPSRSRDSGAAQTAAQVPAGASQAVWRSARGTEGTSGSISTSLRSSPARSTMR